MAARVTLTDAWHAGFEAGQAWHYADGDPAPPAHWPERWRARWWAGFTVGRHAAWDPESLTIHRRRRAGQAIRGGDPARPAAGDQA